MNAFGQNFVSFHSASNSTSTTNSPQSFSSTLSSALPLPTYLPPDPNKKSHARKQPLGHVPRPRNAFILFRCDFVRQKKIPEDVEKNHRNISRIVGKIWHEMTDVDKAPWVDMAEKERAHHGQMYPSSRYAPHFGHARPLSGKRKKRGDERIDPVERAPSPWGQAFQIPKRRSSSCPPPGSVPVSPSRAGFENASGPLTTRDDLARRPSRITMYQSSSPDSLVFHAPSLLLDEFTFPSARGPLGPPLTTGAYSVAPPAGAPGWDAAPPKPQAWNDWNDPLHAQINYEEECFAFEIAQQRSRQMNSPLFTNPFGSSSSGRAYGSQSSTESTFFPLDTATDMGPDVRVASTSPFMGSDFPSYRNPFVYDDESISALFPRLSLENALDTQKKSGRKAGAP